MNGSVSSVILWCAITLLRSCEQNRLFDQGKEARQVVSFTLQDKTKTERKFRRGAVAHRLEQAAHNHLVEGSIPSSPTIVNTGLLIGIYYGGGRDGVE